MLKQTTCLAGNWKRRNEEKAFFCRKGGKVNDRGIILILYLTTCPDIGSPTQRSL